MITQEKETNTTDGELSRSTSASEWITLEEADGVRYRTWKYDNEFGEIADGTLIEVMPGHRTPIKYVETGHVFDQNIQRGNFLLFHLSADGLAVYKYDTSIGEISFSLQVHQGELMCLYALKENDRPGEIVECEQPGISFANLITVSDGTTKMESLEIPGEFWRAMEMLDHGIETDLPVEILDMNEEILEEEEGEVVEEITKK